MPEQDKSVLVHIYGFAVNDDEIDAEIKKIKKIDTTTSPIQMFKLPFYGTNKYLHDDEKMCY